MKERRLVLDLCGGTGAWSKPYADHGFDVEVITLPQSDIREFYVTREMRNRVYGVLAAPPCTHFSIGRQGANTGRDLRGAMELVNECLRIVAECQYHGYKLVFWALENPTAYLRWFLGKPAMSFSPEEFGADYRKPTDLWGNFNTNLRRFPGVVRPPRFEDRRMDDLPPAPPEYVKPAGIRMETVQRSITPPGFARAFFDANSPIRVRKPGKLTWDSLGGFTPTRDIASKLERR